MRGRLLVIFVISSFLFLNAILPQTLAASTLTSPDSIISFSQTNLNMNKNDNYNDSSFWPDGTDFNTTGGYAESFAVVTDWAGVTGYETLGTDDDVGYYTGKDAQRAMRTNSPSVAVTVGDYIEFRYWFNTTTFTQARLRIYTADTSGGSYETFTLTKTTSALTFRSVITLSNVQCVSLIMDLTTGQQVRWSMDYLRIGSATPSGWEHDCSATGNTTGFSSSTGDLLYKEMAPGDAIWSVDATTTAAGINSTSYPFLEINVVDDASGGPWALTGSTATDTYTLHSSSSGTGLFHFNLRSFSANDFYSFTLTPGGITYGYYIKIDWIAVYNIANFTTTITGADVSDVAYVSSNALQITKSSATLFQFDRDPAISVSVPPYESWNISTATPSAVGLSTYISPSWTTVDQVTSATLPTGTTTDVRIRAFASCAISSVKFLYTPEWNQAGLAELWFDTPAWYVVATAILAFWTELNTVALEGLFVIAGLILIPVSTLYLVHGGREDLSNDKVFFFLVLFFVGWALLIGGIMP